MTLNSAYGFPAVFSAPSDAGDGGAGKLKVISEIRTTILEVRDLPTLPTVAMEVMRTVSDRNSSMSQLVDVIEMDVSLTGKILRTANSAYYGVPRKIDNLKMALVVIGMDEIGNLVTTASILKMFPARAGEGTFDVTKFWYHCAAVAELTVGLYDALALTKPGATYVAGLLHDVGRLILFQYFNEYHQEVEAVIKRKGVPPHVAEMEVIGVDHGHIGAWLVERWNLPQEIITAVAQHHIRPPDVPSFSLPVMIDRANELFYVMENNDEVHLVDYIRNNDEWLKWMDARGGSIPSVAQQLYRRRERAQRLLEMLR